MATPKVSLKLWVDTSGKKVLLAEAGKDFVDFLFSILALPIGTVIKLLTAKKMVGCLGNLYDSIEKLNATYMQPNQSKDSVLNPKASVCGAQAPLLLLDSASSTTRRNLYRCVYYQNSSTCGAYVADDPRSLCPNCTRLMSSRATYVPPPTPAPASSSSSTSSDDEGGYVKGIVTYMVMDDLVIKPMSTISTITLLNQFHVKELGSLQEKVVELGMEEGLELLSASLMSKTVLTDVFFGKK